MLYFLTPTIMILFEKISYIIFFIAFSYLYTFADALRDEAIINNKNKEWHYIRTYTMAALVFLISSLASKSLLNFTFLDTYSYIHKLTINIITLIHFTMCRFLFFDLMLNKLRNLDVMYKSKYSIKFRIILYIISIIILTFAVLIKW